MEVIHHDEGVEAALPAPRKPRAVKAAPVPMTPMEMLGTAVQRGASADEIAKLWDIAEKVRQQQAKQAFVSAMNRFKQDPPTIEKTRKAKVTSSKGAEASYAYKFANLADVCNAVIKSLSDVGISHSWASTQNNGTITMRCTLTHEMGHSESTELAAGLDLSGGKNNLQALGSTRTYLERYTLLDVCGLAVDDELDDDGASAGQSEQLGVEGQVSQLLKNARAMADKGSAHFGPFWRSCTEAQRRELSGEMKDFERRMAAAGGGK